MDQEGVEETWKHTRKEAGLSGLLFCCCCCCCINLKKKKNNARGKRVNDHLFGEPGRLSPPLSPLCDEGPSRALIIY